MQKDLALYYKARGLAYNFNLGAFLSYLNFCFTNNYAYKKVLAQLESLR